MDGEGWAAFYACQIWIIAKNRSYPWHVTRWSFEARSCRKGRLEAAYWTGPTPRRHGSDSQLKCALSPCYNSRQMRGQPVGALQYAAALGCGHS